MKRLDEAHHGHIQLQTVRLHPLGDVAGNNNNNNNNESISTAQNKKNPQMRRLA